MPLAHSLTSDFISLFYHFLPSSWVLSFFTLKVVFVLCKTRGRILDYKGKKSGGLEDRKGKKYVFLPPSWTKSPLSLIFIFKMCAISMEKSRVEISTNCSLNIFITSQAYLHIISWSLRKNRARHMRPHFADEIQVNKVKKAAEELVGRAGVRPCPPCSSVLQPPRGWDPHPLQGRKSGSARPCFYCWCIGSSWDPEGSRMGRPPWFSTSNVIC